MEFYRMYINIYTINKAFTIKKIISSRYDLCTKENIKKYDSSNPGYCNPDNSNDFKGRLR